MDKPNVKNEQMLRVFESAARFQKLVPDAVMVGGSAVSAYLGHRYSIDHDHVLADLEERFETIFDVLISQSEWETAHVKDGKIILGSFEGIETGLRQLRRSKPLETQSFVLDNGDELTVPTPEEMIRVKAYLITNRNQVRYYLDVAALAETLGIGFTSNVLLGIDSYYDKALTSSGSVASELLLMLADPEPADMRTIAQLSEYKGIDERFKEWDTITQICKTIAAEMIKTIKGDDK